MIKPEDIVKHIPSGEEWVVCGVNHATGELIPKGYPFPSIAKISDCELIEKRHHIHEQPLESIEALMKHGLENFVCGKSAMLHGII